MYVNIAVCDDEKIICDRIISLVTEIRPDVKIDIYLSGEKLLESKKKYDIILLDIEMPGINGMAVADELRKMGDRVYIIFLTSHSEFMPEAFKVKAFRFLKKPVDKTELAEAISQSEKEILNNEKIIIEEKGHTRLIGLRDLVCIEAFGDGAFLYTTDEVIESSRSLKYWLTRLGSEHFFQVHKSYAVSMAHVINIENGCVYLHNMKDSVPVSRRNIARFRKEFYEYVKRNSKYI